MKLGKHLVTNGYLNNFIALASVRVCVSETEFSLEIDGVCLHVPGRGSGPGLSRAAEAMFAGPPRPSPEPTMLKASGEKVPLKATIISPDKRK